MIMAIYTRPSLMPLCLFVILGVLGGVHAQLVFAPGTESIDENLGVDETVASLTTTGGTGTYAYTIVGTTDQFKIAGAEVKVKSGAVLNFEVENSIEVVIQVVDTPVDPATALTATGTLTVTLIDVNESPNFAMASYAVSMTDGATAGTEVGTFTATDPDAGTNGIASYTIADGDAGNVFINTDGTITVAAGKTLNASALPVYILTFRATDGAGTALTAETKINIAVCPVCSGVSSTDASLATMVAGAVILMTKRYF